MAKSNDQIGDTKRLMGALVKMKPKPHEKMKVGKRIKEDKSKGENVSEHLKHMDVGSRNARLYAKLQSWGLFVLPVFLADDPSQIDYLHVSVELPQGLAKNAAEQSTVTSVPSPMSSSEIVRSISTTERGSANVVNFPSKLRELSVLIPLDEAPVAIHSNVSSADHDSRT